MGELIFGFMVHHAYWETAAAVARDMLAGTVHVQPKDIQEVRLQSILLLQQHCLNYISRLAAQFIYARLIKSGTGIELLISDGFTAIWRISPLQP